MAYNSETDKIDKLATDGLAGTSNSLAYRVHEIEKHFHNTERWFGIQNPQTATDWALSVSEAATMVGSYQAISGNDDYGADANDEAQVWGTADTLGSYTKLDIHDIFITAASQTTVYYLRIVYGSGTMADAITAGQYSELPIIADPAVGTGYGIVETIMMPRITIATDKIWIQAKNTTDNATIDFLVGVHGYVA